jgi:hypothetical protein
MRFQLTLFFISFYFLVYGQGSSNTYNNHQQQQQPGPRGSPQQQYFPLQRQQLLLMPSVLPPVDTLQPQSSVLVSRRGRGMPRARNDDEDSDDHEYQEEEDMSHSPSKKKKKTKKKDGDSFPRRIIKKTTSAVRNTAGAIFGAPKYIYTRYRDTWTGGSKGSKKTSQKKKSKGKVNYKDEEDDKQGWGWGETHYDGGYDGHGAAGYHDDTAGWGWDAKSAGTEADEYERKTNGQNPEYNYKRYLYNQANEINGQEEQGRGTGTAETKAKPSGRLASLKSWFG